MDWISTLLGIDEGRLGDGERSLNWYHMPELWIVVLVIVPAVVIAALFFYSRERKDVSAGVKSFLIFLRSAAVILILFMLFRPVLTAEKIYERRSHVIVLVDESLSMALNDRIADKEMLLAVARATAIAKPTETELTPQQSEAVRSLSRIDIVNKILTNPEYNIRKRLEDKLIVNWLTFSGKIHGGADVGNVKPEGNLTAIGDAILGALNMMRDKHIASVIVFSDGRNNHGRDPVDVARQLGGHNIPIYTIAPGAPQPVKDVELAELEAKETVRANDIVDVDFKVGHKGFEGETVEVTLTEVKRESGAVKLSMDPQKVEERIATGKRVDAARVQLADTSEKQPSRISYKPDKPGEYELILAVPGREGELTTGNNYLSHRIKVVDDKIRVLYVEYPPRYEYRFLKNALVRDHSLQVQCLLLSADSDFPQESTPGTQPLKEFPATMTELMNYDVIILGDVNPSDIAAGGADPDAMAKNIETFVSEFGGGVIFIAGVKDNPASFRDRKLAGLLPVIPEDEYERIEIEKTFANEIGYILTDEGKRHPITRLLPDVNENIELWEDRNKGGDGLRGIYWLSPAKKIKPTATVLVNSQDAPGMERKPLFVAMPYGAGRVFYSATDDTWRWRYIVGDRFFFSFWRNTIDWVMYGKLRGAGRYRVSADKERYAIGETVTVTANAYTLDFEPLQEEELEVNVEPPEGERIKLRLKRAKTGRGGSYSGTFTPRETGHYNLWAGEEAEESTRAYDNFSVFMPNRETDDPTLDIGTLRRMSEEAGDRRNFIPIDEVRELPDRVKQSGYALSEENEDDLWDSPLAYILFALLVTSEWIVRKMNRML